MAAALCALSVVLLFGGLGETVAIADTETDGSISDTKDPGHAHEDSVTTETEPTDSAPGPGVVDTIPEILAALDTESHSPPADEETREGGETHEESPGPAGPMAIGVSTDNETGGAAAVEEDNNGSDSVAAVAAAETNELEVNEPEVVVSHSPVTEPSPEPEAAQEPEAQNADVTAPANDPPVEEPAVQPLTNEVASVDDPEPSVQAEAAPVVGGAAPASEVMTALAYLFIALTDDAVPFIELPENILSLLGLPLMGDGAAAAFAAGGIGGSLFAGGLYTAARTQSASSRAAHGVWPEMLIAVGDSASLSSPGVVSHPAPGGLGASGVAEQHPIGLKAVLADGYVPENVRSLIQHTVDAVLAPLSLLALAALASPGLAGLVLIAAVGMFVGYRQARAASMLRAVGIARFVKAGPLGIARSGGLVALHVRQARATRRQPPRTRELLEPVA